MMKLVATVLLLTSALQASVAAPFAGASGAGNLQGLGRHFGKRWGRDCDGGSFIASNNFDSNNQNCNTEAECCHKLQANVCCEDNQAFSTCNDHRNANSNNFVSDNDFCKKAKRWGGGGICSPHGWGDCDNDCDNGGGSFVASNNCNSNNQNCNNQFESCHKLSANVCCEDNQACQSCNDHNNFDSNNFYANNDFCKKAKRCEDNFGSFGNGCFNECDDFFSPCGSPCGFSPCDSPCGFGFNGPFNGCGRAFNGCEGPFNQCGRFF